MTDILTKYINIFIKNTINGIITMIMFHAQLVLSCEKLSQYLPYFSKCIQHSKIDDNYHFYAQQLTFMQSEDTTTQYPESLMLSGNIAINYNDHILTANNIIITHHYDKINNNIWYTLNANGNINYRNNYIILTGDRAWYNLRNKNINIYHGQYHLLSPNIHGTADIIMQRNNNRYTIIQNGNFTSCESSNHHWSILGSKMIYDYCQHRLDIWNAYFKIQNTSVFYSPYLSLSFKQNKIASSYIPNVKYSSIHGLQIKIPFPFQIFKHYLGNISPCYLSKTGITLQTKIDYMHTPNIGIINLKISTPKIAKHHIFDKKNYHYILWNLHWRHNSTILKKYKLISNYLSKINYNYFENQSFIYTNALTNDHIDQKILIVRNNKYWDAKIIYLGNAFNKNTTQNTCNYTAAPLLELNSYYYTHIKKIPLNINIYNQLVKFISNNQLYPRAIRIHTSPNLRLLIRNYWGNFDTAIKLHITHYQQTNIQHYNSIKKYHLKNTVNRIIPQFQCDGKIFFYKKLHKNKKYQHFLESRLQYLYIPYHFQENIGIYDSNRIHINHSNIFYNFMYSGLDRINQANQITGDITIHYYNNNDELLYASIRNILKFSQFCHVKNKKFMLIQNTYPYGSTLISGIGHWNINNHWSVHNEIQYSISTHNLSFGTTILEYIGEHNQIFQVNYRYINAHYINDNPLYDNKIQKPILHKTINQLGCIIYYTIYNNWNVGYSYYHDVKTNQLINQIISARYYTPCWSIKTMFEQKTINYHKIIQNKIYDYRIKLNIQIYTSLLQADHQSDLRKILKIGTISHQHEF